MMNHQAFDYRLKQAFEIYNKNWISTFPSEEQLDASVELSSEFHWKMKALIRIQKKPYYIFVNTTTRKVASFILIVLLALSAATFSVKALREPVIHFIIEVYEKISSVVFEREGGDGLVNPVITTLYVPGYIPDGFEKTIENRFDQYSSVDYKSGDQIIHFAQMLPDNSQIQIDTEGTTTSEIVISGFDGIYFFNKNNHNIMWTANNYVFYVSGTIPKSELIAVAESINPEIPAD